MTKLHASWIHGTGVQAEREGYYISKRFAGYGAMFKTHGKEWFHFAIPTPVIVDGHRASLSKVFLLFDTKQGATIQELAIYDGPILIKHIKDLSLSGDYSNKIVAKNMWVIDPQPSIKYGVGLSFFVDFGKPNPSGLPYIKFVTAGADFNTP
jgi:hypothetical protein